MKNHQWIACAAWMVIALETVALGLWGAAVASSAVAVNRWGFIEFGICGFAMMLCLTLVASGHWKLIAIPVGLFVYWSIAVGWDAEPPRFALGQGAPWVADVSIQGIGFLSLLVVASGVLLYRRSGKPRRDKDEVGDPK
jgi:hypothetical protein